MPGQFTRIPHAELEEMARAQYARAFPEGPPQRVPRPRNIGPTLQSVGADRIAVQIRGRSYELLPVSFEDGLRLLQAKTAVEGLDDDNPVEDDFRVYREALETTVRLSRKYLRPTGPVRRLLWHLRIRPSPLRGATETEVGQVLGFLLGCRMRSRVRYPAS